MNEKNLQEIREKAEELISSYNNDPDTGFFIAELLTMCNDIHQVRIYVMALYIVEIERGDDN